MLTFINESIFKGIALTADIEIDWDDRVIIVNKSFRVDWSSVIQLHSYNASPTSILYKNISK